MSEPVNLSPKQDHEVTEYLIIFVQGEENIYKKTNADYKDNVKRDNSFEKISKLIADTYGLKISGEFLRDKWDKLWTRYQKEINDRKKVPKSGSGAKFSKQWTYFKSMHSLYSTYVEQRPIRSSLNSNENIVPDEDKITKNKNKAYSKFENDLEVSTRLIREQIESLQSAESLEKEILSEDDIDTDAYCEAVIQAYDELDESDRMDGMLLAINNINSFLKK